MKDTFKKGFEAAKSKAEDLIQDKNKTQKVMKEALHKAQKNEKIFAETKVETFAVFRLISAWSSGEYKRVPAKAMIALLAAILYFLNPMDVIPDFIVGLGFVDDLSVLGFVLNLFKKDISDFLDWEKQNKN